MPSVLKLGYKHQRERQVQKKREKHTTFIPVGFTAAPPLSSFFSASKTWYSLPQKFRKSPFKIRESTPNRIWRISPPFLFPLFFSSSISFLSSSLSPSFSHFYVYLFPSKTGYLTSFYTPSVPGTPPISLGLPSSINTPLFTRSKVGHIYPFT